MSSWWLSRSVNTSPKSRPLFRNNSLNCGEWCYVSPMKDPGRGLWIWTQPPSRHQIVRCIGGVSWKTVLGPAAKFRRVFLETRPPPRRWNEDVSVLCRATIRPPCCQIFFFTVWWIRVIWQTFFNQITEIKEHPPIFSFTQMLWIICRLPPPGLVRSRRSPVIEGVHFVFK